MVFRYFIKCSYLPKILPLKKVAHFIKASFLGYTVSYFPLLDIRFEYEFNPKVTHIRELHSCLCAAAASRVIPACTFYVCSESTKENWVAPAIKHAELKASAHRGQWGQCYWRSTTAMGSVRSYVPYTNTNRKPGSILKEALFCLTTKK